MAFNDKPVRRAQLISPFGVGAIVDFPNDESLMAAGLDVWPEAYGRCPHDWHVLEERLARRLDVDHFRLPPDFRRSDQDELYRQKMVPFVRFPRWHYCPDRNCGEMVKLPIYGAGAQLCRSKKHEGIPQRRRPRLIPVRFVAVCEHGHIEDFPFFEWAHSSKGKKQGGEQHQLVYRAGRSAALSGITISCRCGQSRTMAGATSYSGKDGGALSKIKHLCGGVRPWLGEQDPVEGACNAHLRTVQKGGSNVYFAVTFSSIYLPLWAEQSDARIVKILENPARWQALSGGLLEGKYIALERCNAIADLHPGIDPVALQTAAQRKLDNTEGQKNVSEEQYRFSEYEAFRLGRGGEHTELFSEVVPINQYQDWMHKYFEQVALVRKLKETRALAGFTRLQPYQSSSPDSAGYQSLSRSKGLGWLPASVVRGEGIFIEFKRKWLTEWEKDPDVAKRVADHLQTVNQSRLGRGLAPELLTPRYLLIHTFAHLLIKQLSYDCGYGSSALRERLYCNLEQEDLDMCGVLVYTAAGDSEGTMGGLVRQGEPGYLEETVRQCLLEALWCSSDPVCSETSSQGTDNANMAACHGCALLPETACEKGNRLLDRVLVNNDTGAFPRSYFKLVR
ncbi:DrmB family protein [Pseudomonadota bacterium]